MDDVSDPLLNFFSPPEASTENILYITLSVQPAASAEEIKKAYRLAALRLHPDKHAGKSDEEKEKMGKEFQKVGFAYAVLGDEKKRKRYVEWLGPGKSAGLKYGVAGMTRPAGPMRALSPMRRRWGGTHTSKVCLSGLIERSSMRTRLSIRVSPVPRSLVLR
jgi:curved DNA-binding protein CbpA